MSAFRAWRAIALLFLALPVLAQTHTGELRIQVVDPDGHALPSRITLVSEANEVSKTLATNSAGVLDASALPFGVYRIQADHNGFNPAVQTVEIRSVLPVDCRLTLAVATVASSVEVQDSETLVDPHSVGNVERLGKNAIVDRQASLPGRSLVDLVDSEPGWLYEGNAVLHPRGSEYQTQFVVDGIPYTDNRSPGFGPQLDADEIQSMSVYTASIPAEYGRKLGGVVEVNTAQDTRPGFHGSSVFSGGSFGTADGSLSTQYAWGHNVAGIETSGAHTDWYENPPVLQNFTNAGTTADSSGRYARDFGDKDRVTLSARHALARFLVPNEQLQQQAGQHQSRDVLETMGSAAWQHIFSPDLLLDLRSMVRDSTTHLDSNAESTPILAFQDRGFREGYAKASLSLHHKRQEWKFGIDGDLSHIHEQFSDRITDPSQFDPGTPSSFSFSQQGSDREWSAFAQDELRLGNWSVSAGLRFDHYRLVVHQDAFSPRLGVAHFWPSANLVAHLSYDRVFQTPAFENILLSSSPSVVSLDPEVLRVPVQPSQGNYYEAGITKGFANTLKLDVNAFLRNVDNFADDDQLLDTAVSFPIAFRKARIYGAEGKLDLPRWGRLSGFASYSYMVGAAYLPVTGGLFLGDDASQALSQANGRFWVSQDQRNTLRLRYRYRFARRVWAAAGAEYGSGLPTEFDGTLQDAIAQYGQKLVSRVNFADGRVKPSLSINTTLGVDILKRDAVTMRIQADAENLSNRVNLIDFAGLFSGNAVAPPRSYGLRLTTEF